MLTVDELFNLFRFNTSQFFSVTFERRTDAPGRPAGTPRTMLCRTQVQKYQDNILGPGVRDAEDYRHGILTVFDVGTFTSLLRDGMDKETAGRRSWRRIDLTSITACSIVPGDDLPPPTIMALHDITNVFRRDNIPNPV